MCPSQGRGVQRRAVGGHRDAQVALERLERGARSAEPDVEKVDVGDRERDVPVDHDTAVEEPVDQVDKGDLACLGGPPHLRVAYGTWTHRAASIDPLTK